MARTIIDLPPTQLADLDALCASLGISRAEAVRRAVQAFLLKPAADEAPCFGLWNRGESSGERQGTKGSS
jgi:metal-responsive CopG/Arc/MetJ family transcriptional regulator